MEYLTTGKLKIASRSLQCKVIKIGWHLNWVLIRNISLLSRFLDRSVRSSSASLNVGSMYIQAATDRPDQIKQYVTFSATGAHTYQSMNNGPGCLCTMFSTSHCTVLCKTMWWWRYCFCMRTFPFLALCSLFCLSYFARLLLSFRVNAVTAFYFVMAALEAK